VAFAFVLSGVIGLVALWAAPVAAHAFLVNTSPQSGDRLASSPELIEFQFSEAIVPGSQRIAVRNSDGADVSIESTELTSENSQLRAPLPQIPKGIYVVSWRVVSPDAHVEAGEFAFGVRVRGGLTAAPATSQPFPWTNAAASWLLLTGLVLAIGGLVSESLVWIPVGKEHWQSIPAAPIRAGLGLAAFGAILQLVLLVSNQPDGIAAAVRTRPGMLTALEGLFIAAAIVLVLARLRPWALLPLAAAIAAAAWRGHSGTSGEWWAAPANALHVALAGVWVGALAYLVIVLWRVRRRGFSYFLRAAANRYAQMALVLVPPLVALGTITAFAEFTRLSQLTGTTYGRVLLVKLTLVTVALAFALTARLRALRTNPPRTARLRRLISAEGVALLAVIVVTAVLVNVAPPRTAVASGDLLGPPPVPSPAVRLAERAGELSLYLAAAPHVLRLEVRGPGDAPINAELDLEGTDSRGDRFNIYPRTCGSDCFTMDFDWRRGLTRLSATLSSDVWKAGAVDFAVPWPPRPAKQELLGRVIRTMRRQEEFVLKEAVTSTGGDPPFRALPVTGKYFASQELFGAGGAGDIGFLPAGRGDRSVSLYLPGSDTSYRIWIDNRYRLRREMIINPGHRIERRFDYRRSAG
jgi:copper transport protein